MSRVSLENGNLKTEFTRADITRLPTGVYVSELEKQLRDQSNLQLFDVSSLIQMNVDADLDKNLREVFSALLNERYQTGQLALIKVTDYALTCLNTWPQAKDIAATFHVSGVGIRMDYQTFRENTKGRSGSVYEGAGVLHVPLTARNF